MGNLSITKQSLMVTLTNVFMFLVVNGCWNLAQTKNNSSFKIVKVDYYYLSYT